MAYSNFSEEASVTSYSKKFRRDLGLADDKKTKSLENYKNLYFNPLNDRAVKEKK